jgi:hypothetical protein
MPVRKRRNAMILAVPLGLVVSGALVYQSSSAAFTATTTTAQESWTAGKVLISQNSSTSLPWTAVSALSPSSPAVTKCVLVDYAGDLNANISLYVTGYATTYLSNDSSNLEDYLQFTVKGIDGNQTSDANGTCAPGAGTGTQVLSPTITSVTAKNLNASWSTYANGTKVSNVTAGGTSAGHHLLTYMITYAMDSAATNFAQGDNVRLNFTWEAQSV